MGRINTIKKIRFTLQSYGSVIYPQVMSQMEGNSYCVQA